MWTWLTTHLGTDAPGEAPTDGGRRPRDRPAWLVLRAMQGLAVLVAGRGLLDFLHRAAERLDAPYPIAWIEPVLLREALQVAAGLPLHGPPSADHIPSIYNPALAWLGGWVLRLTGPGYPPLRVIAALSLLATSLVLGRWVLRETGDRLWAVLCAVAVLAISLPLHDWLLQLNVDMPCLAAGLAGLFLLRFHGRRRSAVVAAGLLLLVSFLFKQNGLLFGAAGLLYLTTVRDGRWGLLAGVLGLGLALTVGGLLLVSEGRYWQTAVAIPLASLRKVEPRTLAELTRSPALALLSGACLSLSLYAGLTDGTGRGRMQGIAGAAALGVAWLAFGKDGAARNSFLPVYLFGVLALGLAPAWLGERGAATGDGSRPRPASPAVRATLLLVLVLVLRLGQEPRPAPGPDRALVGPARFDRLIAETVRRSPGPVFVGVSPLAQALLGMPQNFHQSSLYEGTVRTRRYDVARVLGPALAAHRWRTMIVWQYDDPAFEALLARHYRRERLLGRDPFLGLPVGLWVPRGPERPAR